jgi:hypothetical protein
MRIFTIGTALIAALLLAIAPAVAQSKSEVTQKTKADCPPSPSASPGAQTPAAAPEKIEGTVTDIDGKNNMVSVRTPGGQMHQFRGNPETIKDLKVGDKLELNKRAASAQNC